MGGHDDLDWGISPDPFDDCRWDDNRIEAEKTLLFHEQVIGTRLKGGMKTHRPGSAAGGVRGE